MSALLAFVGISHLWKHYEKMLNFSLIADRHHPYMVFIHVCGCECFTDGTLIA